MRLPKTLAGLALSLLVVAPAAAQAPADVQKLIDAVKSDKAAVAAAQKKEADDTAALLAAVEALDDQLDELGLGGDNRRPRTFAAKLKAAVKADNAPAASVKLYAALWRVAGTTTVRDEGVKTAGALLDELAKAVKNLGLPHGSLDHVARVVADELNGTLPKQASAPLDAATRKVIADKFAAVAAALEGVVK